MSRELDRRLKDELHSTMDARTIAAVCNVEASVFAYVRQGVGEAPAEEVADVDAAIAVATLPPAVVEQVVKWLQTASHAGFVAGLSRQEGGS